MSVTELKLQIINKISSIEDKLVLQEIFKLVEIESEMDSIYRLTNEERKSLEAGLNDVKKGRVYSSEDADNMVKEWLRK